MVPAAVVAAVMAINALRVVRTSDTTPRRVPRRRTGTAQLRRRRADPARRTLVEDTGEEQTPAALPAGTPRQTRGHRKVQTAGVRPAKGRPHTDGRNRIRPSDPHYAVSTPPAEPRGPGPPHQGVATASRTTAETDASEVVKLPPAPVSSSTRGCLPAPRQGVGIRTAVSGTGLPASVAQPDNQTTFQHHCDRALAHQNGPRPRQGHRELGIDAAPAVRVAAAFTELARAI
jgi:hypothetical protein